MTVVERFGFPPTRSRLASLGASTPSLHLTPVGHIVSGWGQMQGGRSFGPRKRGGCERHVRGLVRSLERAASAGPHMGHITSVGGSPQLLPRCSLDQQQRLQFSGMRSTLRVHQGIDDILARPSPNAIPQPVEPRYSKLRWRHHEAESISSAT